MSLDGNSDETNGYNSVIKNGEVPNANFVKSVIVPIGSIVPWLKSLTGCPALPDGWVECDGSVLSDSDSPFNGQTIPNLNTGTYRMLRGAATSGATGGADTHTLSAAEMPAHVHSQAPPASGAGSGGWSIGAPSGTLDTGSAGSSQAHNNLPAYYSVVFIIRVK